MYVSNKRLSFAATAPVAAADDIRNVLRVHLPIYHVRFYYIILFATEDRPRTNCTRVHLVSPERLIRILIYICLIAV